MDRFRRVLGLKEEQLSDHDVGSIVGDRTVDTHDSLFEKAREDVVGSLPS